MPLPLPSPTPGASSSLPSWWPWWISPLADVIGIGGSAAAVWGAVNVSKLRNMYTDLRTEPLILGKIEAISLRIEEHHGTFEDSIKVVDVDLKLLSANLKGLGKTSKGAAGKEIKALSNLIDEYSKINEHDGKKEKLWSIYGTSQEIIERLKNEQDRRNATL